MLNRKKIIIILIIIAAIAVLAYIWLGLIGKKGDSDIIKTDETDYQDQQNLPIDNFSTQDDSSKTDNTMSISSAEKDRRSFENTAKFFIEMLGSYSPDANFQNIIDLESLMTQKMQTWAENFIIGNRDNGSKESITTTVTNSKILNYSSNSGTILFNTRRNKLIDNNVENYNQDVKVDLIRMGSDWKIDNVSWQ